MFCSTLMQKIYNFDEWISWPCRNSWRHCFLLKAQFTSRLFGSTRSQLQLIKVRNKFSSLLMKFLIKVRNNFPPLLMKFLIKVRNNFSPFPMKSLIKVRNNFSPLLMKSCCLPIVWKLRAMTINLSWGQHILPTTLLATN